ncbi:sulfatase family protein [Flavilitoribacter nigricans]|uniref:sulfatase family protein n=1 Tax=Flavilitoribacter nigricans TaxID=70997 RepID=UPI003743D75A
MEKLRARARQHINLPYLLYGLIGLFGFAACAPEAEETDGNPPARPNIVFIMTDDHGYQAMSAYDDRYIQTPNLDRIAEEGVLFTNSFVTNSICAPSRAVLLTGKHSHLNGQIDNRVRFDSSQATFPKYLQAAGYQTALVGKWHLRSEPTGFDHYERLIGQGNYYNSDFIENGERKQSAGYVTDVITDKSINWLDKRDPNKPFCLLVHHKATHRIWMPDTALLNDFAGVEFPVPDNYFDAYEGREAATYHEMGVFKDMDIVYDLKMLDKEGEFKTRYRAAYERMYGRMNDEQRAAWDAFYDPVIKDFMAAKLEGKDLALWKYQRYMQDYLKCVRSVDNNVGRLLDYLDDNGLAENTLVVYTSDQGFYLGEHGWFDKRYMYEESLRTPLAMRFPQSLNISGKSPALVQNIDYAPTFMDLAGLDVPEDMQGKSLIPLLQGDSTEWRQAIYYHYYEYPNEHGVKKHYGVRTDRYKLIHFYGDIDTWELYDLREDPHEMNNLYGEPAYESVVTDLKLRIDDLQETYAVDLM